MVKVSTTDLWVIAIDLLHLELIQERDSKERHFKLPHTNGKIGASPAIISTSNKMKSVLPKIDSQVCPHQASDFAPHSTKRIQDNHLEVESLARTPILDEECKMIVKIIKNGSPMT